MSSRDTGQFSASFPRRLRTQGDYQNFTPVHVVWEITLACDLKCLHCGSRAGGRRPQELSTQECLNLVDALANLGVREITLIGGEVYLRKDWLKIVAAIQEKGILCSVQTGGKAFSEKLLRQAVDAGLSGIGVSIDGCEKRHNQLRGSEGSYQAAINTLKVANQLGMRTSVNTQIGADSLLDLPELFATVVGIEAKHWQLQLTVAMGNAVDNDWLLFQPYQLIDLMPMIVDLFHKGLDHGLLVIPANNIGYFGPYEHFLRQDFEINGHWGGCGAGQTVIGIEADGTIKGCPSLPTIGYAGGNIREHSLESIWNNSSEIHFGRLRSRADLWGFCNTCYYADACLGGCTWTTHSLLGKAGNNPFCHYRALELQRQGIRERIVKTQEAKQASFAIGKFSIIEEPFIPTIQNSQPLISKSFDAAVPVGHGLLGADKSHGRPPAQLIVCRSCNQYIYPHEVTCPHCGEDVKEYEMEYQKERERRHAVIREVEGLLAEYTSQGMQN